MDGEFVPGGIYDFVYENPPVPEDKQYRIGEKVEIWDTDKNELIGKYIVMHTNETHVGGIFIGMNEEFIKTN